MDGMNGYRERGTRRCPRSAVRQASSLRPVVGVFLAVLLVLAWAQVALALPAIAVRTGPTVGPGESKRIALTFDDNFRPEYSIPLLGYLRDNQVKATLFVTARYVDGFPELTAFMAKGGFEIGDHSATHPFLTTVSPAQLREEIGAGIEAFERATGVKTAKLLRPPYGAYNDDVLRVAGEKGIRYVVNWDIDTSDWTGCSAETITERVLANAHDGAIVLMHMSALHTWEAIPMIVQGLHQLGYEMVTVSELLKQGRTFVDVAETTPGSSAIDSLVAAGIMSGYDDFFFGPTDPMTRAQVAKVAVLTAALHTEEIEVLDSPTFRDVPVLYDRQGVPLPYPLDFVEEAALHGLVAGMYLPDGAHVFMPENQITRVQLAQIVARMLRELKGYPEQLPGGPEIHLRDVPAHARADVILVAQLGIMNGYSDGSFAPYSQTIRGHVALVMQRFRDLSDYHSAPDDPPAEPGDPPVEPDDPSAEDTPTTQPPADDQPGGTAPPQPPTTTPGAPNFRPPTTTTGTTPTSTTTPAVQ